MTAELDKFDFGKPCRLPTPIERKLLAWQAGAGKLVRDKLSDIMPFDCEVASKQPQNAKPERDELEEFLQAFVVSIAGQSRTTLLGCPARFALSLVEGLLGQIPEEIPEPRELTQIEQSMLDVVIRLLLEAFNESATNSALPACSLGRIVETPHLLRLFPGIGDLVTLQIVFRLPCGEFVCPWYWPEELVYAVFQVDESFESDADTAEEISHLAKRITFDVSVRLGDTRLEVSDLADLEVGDVIILEQYTTEPLKAFVADRCMFEVWPGSRGKHQAIQIEHVTDA